MNCSYSVFGIHTGLIQPHDDIVGCLLTSVGRSPARCIEQGDIIVIAESVLATVEGRIVPLNTITPSPEAQKIADRYDLDPGYTEVVIRESDTIVGGISGFLLCMKNGILLPNAGVDASNAPLGCVVLLPADPNGSAFTIRQAIEQRCDVKVGVIIADSCVHAMRSGCSGIALGCSGIASAVDEAGKNDLFGRPLPHKQRAVADMIASVAEIVMGEADEEVPFAVVRGLGIPITEQTGVEGISLQDCFFMKLMKENRVIKMQ